MWYPIDHQGAVTFTYSTQSTTSETMTVTYSNAMTNSTLKAPVLGITDLQYIISSFTIDISVLYTARTTTSFTFLVEVNANSNLKLLKITYLAIDNAFTPAVSLNYLKTVNDYVCRLQPYQRVNPIL
jgi:hypothetical protein